MDQGASSSGLIPRFGALVGRIKQAVAEGAGRDTRRLGVLSVLLWGYLGRALQRLAALETRRLAGTLPSHAPADRKLRPVHCRPADGTAATPDASCTRIPYGPVLLRFHAAHLAFALERLLGEPDVQALLAAAPQAGRVLRPLWRMLSTDPPPQPLRLPPRKRRIGAAAGEAGPPAKPPRRIRRTPQAAWWVGPPSRPRPSRIAARSPLLPDW